MKKLILFQIFFSIISCNKSESSLENKKLNSFPSEKQIVNKENYEGKWNLRKIGLAWTNKDSIINNNSFLEIENGNIKFYENGVLKFNQNTTITKNKESEIGKYLMNINNSNFHAFDYLTDSLIVYSNAYDENVLIFQREK